MPRRNWPPYQTVRALIHAHVGRTAVIMGGGPSLSEGMESAPRDAVYISVNDHGVRWLSDRWLVDPRRCEYIVACDNIELRARGDIRIGKGKLWRVPVIGRHMWVDYRLLYMPGPIGGQVAAWVARLMGCSPIIVLGMDLYDGPTYHDNPRARSTGRNRTPRQHLEFWATLIQRYPAQYRAIGCHPMLRELIGIYDPKEPADPPVERERLEREINARRVRLLRQVSIRTRSFPAGEEIDLSIAEAARFIKERKAAPIELG